MASACMSVSYVKQAVCTPTAVLASGRSLCCFPASSTLLSSSFSKTNLPFQCSRKIHGYPACAFNPSEYKPFNVEELEARFPESNYKPLSRLDDKTDFSNTETSSQDSQPSEYKPFSFDELELKTTPKGSLKFPKQKHKAVSTNFQPLRAEYPPITLEELETKVAASNYEPFSRFEGKAHASSNNSLGLEHKPFAVDVLEQKFGDISYKPISKQGNRSVSSTSQHLDSEHKPFTVEEHEQKISESSSDSFSSQAVASEVKSVDSSFKPFTVEELEQKISSSSTAVKEPQFPAVEASSSSEESSISSESIFSEVEPPKLTKLYVGNIPWNYDNQQLDELFKHHGSVFVAEVVLDKATGRSRGFGFVYMNSPEDAEVAIRNLDGKEVVGRQIRVSYQESADERSQRLARSGYGQGSSNVHKLFVANLPWSANDETLGSLFSEYGTVVQARVVVDRETGRSKGFGFVTLSSDDEVNNAVASLNGSDYAGRPLRVAVAGERPASRSAFF